VWYLYNLERDRRLAKKRRKKEEGEGLTVRIDLGEEKETQQLTTYYY